MKPDQVTTALLSSLAYNDHKVQLVSPHTPKIKTILGCSLPPSPPMQLPKCASCNSVLPLPRPHTTCHAPLTNGFYKGMTSGALRKHGHLAYCLLSVTGDTVSTLAIESSEALSYRV